jgi:hypothetical protein
MAFAFGSKNSDSCRSGGIDHYRADFTDQELQRCSRRSQRIGVLQIGLGRYKQTCG